MEDQIAEIKAHMPLTYRAIQSKADQCGRVAYQMVRRGLAGRQDCFYAMERGRVVGTPFAQAVAPDVAALMVQFGVGFMIMWAPLDTQAAADVEKEAAHGAH